MCTGKGTIITEIIFCQATESTLQRTLDKQGIHKFYDFGDSDVVRAK